MTTEMKQLTSMPAWGTKNVKEYEYFVGSKKLTTRKAIKMALDSGKIVMHGRVKKRKYRKDRDMLVGSKTLVCPCGAEVTVDANTLAVTCYKCTNKMAIKQAGFLHSKSAAEQDPQKKEKKSMASKKKNSTEKAKSSHMSVEAIRDRFDNPSKDRKPGYFVKVFSALKSAKTTTVQELSEKAAGWKSTPDKYKDTEKLATQLRFYAKNIWGKRTGLVKLEGDTLTYVAPEDRA